MKLLRDACITASRQRAVAVLLENAKKIAKQVSGRKRVSMTPAVQGFTTHERSQSRSHAHLGLISEQRKTVRGFPFSGTKKKNKGGKREL